MGSGWARTVFMGMDRRRFLGRGGILFGIFFGGNCNCHCYYRHSSLRWKKDVELELYPKVFIIIRLFPSKQNRKTVQIYLLV